jgi:m7GpppX diphosphatase
VRVRETPAQYAAETLPMLPARKLAAAWVRKIIDGSKAGEDVVVREPDWVLVRDYKKCDDPHKPADAYYVALFEDAGLGSLRDLRAEHLPLLRRVLGEAPAVVHARLAAADPDAPLPQLVCFVQYEPLYWYLHVHVVSVQHKMFTEWTGGNLALMALDRWHSLEDVIGRLELHGDYYAHAALPCLVKRQRVGTSSLAACS